MARTMLTLVPSRHCPKAQGQQQLVPAMRHARCAGGRSTPKCRCWLRRAVPQPPVARKITNGTERRGRAARAIRRNGHRGWGTMQANRSKPALVCVYARLHKTRVLGRHCPEAQEQQQLRAAMAPGWARGLRTARGTAEAGALGIGVIYRNAKCLNIRAGYSISPYAACQWYWHARVRHSVDNYKSLAATI